MFMRLVSNRPLVVFDLETTGTNASEDRIVEFAATKFLPAGGTQSVHYLVNPGRPIPAEASAVHGITDEKVKDAPHFSHYAETIAEFIEDSDLCGFNILLFDVPCLFHEFARSGYDWPHHRHQMVDVGNLFKIREPRTLSAAHNFYCGTPHEGAHSAAGDVKATAYVLQGMLQRYEDLPGAVDLLALASNYGKKRADITCKFTVNEAGEYVLNFGPNRGHLAANHPDYLQWMLSKDFPDDALAICEEILYPVRRCRVCRCTEADCSQCIEAQGFACHWVAEDLCSRCQAEGEAARAQL